MKNQISILRSFLFLFIIGAGGFASAQTDSCIIYLKTAGTSYDQREFDAGIRLLQRALQQCNLDNADKLQAHKMLALSYLAIDNLEAADKEAGIIMKQNPNYLPDKFKDEPKYSALFAKYKPVPVLRIGTVFGLNHTNVTADKYYSITHPNEDLAKQNSSYTEKRGFQLGAAVDYRIIKGLWIEAQGLFRVSSYEHTLTNVENTTIQYSERLTYADVPDTLQYNFLNKDISPYVEGGMAFSFTNSALGTTSRDDTKDIVNRIDYRNTFNKGLVYGLGVNYRMKGFNLSFNVRNNQYNNYVNKENTRYSDLVNVFKYYYIDNDFKLSNLQFSVGAKYSILYKNITK